MGQHVEIANQDQYIRSEEGLQNVVRLDQPYRNYAVDLLMPQHYAKDDAIR